MKQIVLYQVSLSMGMSMQKLIIDTTINPTESSMNFLWDRSQT